MNEQINLVAAVMIIIIKHLVSSPQALLRLILFCWVFPFSGSDNSLPELPVIGPKI